ncbi:Magnesium transporter MgtE [Hydrogenovibrio crunogenus]|uniref:Magnesium transporter MgtE n=1 Tax=Hydrogenovibrio crunogenus TaxID=39765 RepID=A0A4P7P1W4_9GAMM|nr:magnesium transporter [Hydrogenovibrio crunogenus]QBZ84107.1 Magnesium transporter MgtE [Hydrogenovibrio crunogenus]
MTVNEETPFSSEEKLVQLQALLTQEDQTAVCDFFVDLPDTEIALLLESFPASDREKIWVCVPEDLKGEVLAEVGDDVRSALMSEMALSDVSELTKDLGAQDIAEILDTVHESVKEAVIDNLDDSTREQVQALHAYDDNMVGRYMDPSTVNIKQDVTLETVQRYIRIKGLLDETTQEFMVTDKDNRLVGSLGLVDLVKQNQEAEVSEFMHQSVSLLDEMNVHDAAVILRSKELRFAPVVNQEGILVGQLNIDHIMEITREDADNTLLSMSGVSDDEELFAPILSSAKSRGIWLGINLATAFLAAYVIGQFEAVLSQVVALAVLMPVVASMGGIAGSQTLTVIIRGLAMGQVGGNNRWWLFNKELWVGALNGLVWALVVGGVAQLWFDNWMMSLVITLAIVINMTVANVSGIAIPLLLRRMKIDPALSGAVILTTVTDVVGFMSFLGLATLLILT